jgi:hypothetical protein
MPLTFRADHFFPTPNQLLELMAAMAAAVVVDRHELSMFTPQVQVKGD